MQASRTNFSSPEIIDAVYLWCDGSDPSFIKQKNETFNRFHLSLDQDNVGDLRFADNEELRFSLRSLWINVPWINHIYIVTNEQIPRWLKEHPKITIVDHKQIIPKELLPTFNSVVIEMFVHLIPGLQEKYLLLNDDVFVRNPVTPSFFFHKNLPIVRLKEAEDHFPTNVSSAQNFLSDPSNPSFEKTQVRALLLAWKKYGVSKPLVLTHTVDSFTKAAVRNTLRTFPQILSRNESPFRNGEEIQRLIFQLHFALELKATVKIFHRLTFTQKYLPFFSKRPIECFEGTECEKVRNRIRTLRPTLFCLNSDIQMNPINRMRSKNFLEEIFPIKAPWE